MSDKDYVNLMPSPSSLMESLRDIGYSMETAVADIIDNSITAGSRNVDIRFSWNAGKPWLAVVDNGCGMSKAELVSAMRFGSASPLKRRAANDLGRFGLGLKTASISQCRHLIVASKQGDEFTACEWDLDQVEQSVDGQWRLGLLTSEECGEHTLLGDLVRDILAPHDSGTLVLWQRFDRLGELGAPLARERTFNALLGSVRSHLELVFHRYLRPDPGKRRLIITMNGAELAGFDPFHPGTLATQELPVQRFRVEDQEVVVQPYILPHHTKVSREDYDRYAGEGGYLHNQGFYVYRNRRLIIKATWFRLMKKAELSKLVRVRVDIPNTLDHLWKIDVKKSAASPPESVRQQLRQVLGRIEIQGRRVYTQTGQRLTANVQTPAWHKRAKSGSIFYEINRDYPPLKQLKATMQDGQRETFDALLSTLEQTFPRDLFFHDVADTPEKLKAPVIDQSALENLLDQFLAFWSPEDISSEELAERILAAEPFASNRDAAKSLLTERGYLS